MLKVENVYKTYKNNSGNFNISLEVPKGQVYGLMGPNGAGKSTLLKQILGFVKSDSGTIRLDGKVPFVDGQKIMEFSGYIPGEVTLYDGLTGVEYLKIIANLKENVDWGFVERLFDFFGLDASKKIKKMSSGMKQKVAIIAAVMHKPKFLVLDEPTRGLDAAASEQFKDLIFRFKKQFKTTIIFCSHIFDEIASTCDRVGFISNGVLTNEYNVGETSMQEISQKFVELFKNNNVKGLF